MNTVSLPCSLQEMDGFDSNSILKEDITLKIDFHRLINSSDSLLYESSLAHWIIGLWHFAEKNKLKISVDAPGLTIDQIAASMPGAVLVLLATSGKISGLERYAASGFRQKYFEIQKKWPDLALSNSAYLLCQDSYSDGLPIQLYPNKNLKSVIDPKGFEYVVESMIQAVVSEELIKGEIVKRSGSIALILHELFKNTHDHARSTFNDEIIGQSIRGLYCRFYTADQLSHEIINKDIVQKNAAELFAEKLITSRKLNYPGGKNTKPINGLLEISIFDSGSGLASKWRKGDVSNLDPQLQYQSVLECLKKGQSSIPSSERGYGLWKVLDTLRTLKGFISVRTNAVHSLRQFAFLENRAVSTTRVTRREVPLEIMYDWRRRGASEKLSDYPHYRGALISVLIPLGEL